MKRIDKVREYIRQNGLEGFFISSYENRRYLSGFTGSNGFLVITESDLVLITDPRYTEQATKQAPNYSIFTHGLNPFETIKSVIDGLSVKSLGYETEKVSDYEIRMLKNILPELIWTAVEKFGIRQRAVKDEEEIAAIKKAVEIADNAMAKFGTVIRAGITEREAAVELEYILAREGSEGTAFGTIVASGKRSSLPHGVPSEKVIEKGDMVVIDYGACYKGYMSDITRTLWIGKQDERMTEIFNIVVRAQDAAIRAIKPGTACKDIDRAHREVFLEHGVEKYSLRGLGHGVGLEIHEYPRVVMDNEDIIVPGMVFTVEPGIYIPDLGGVRLEDIVLVTDKGCQDLTRCPRIIQVDG